MAAYESGLRAAGGCRVTYGDGHVIELPIDRWLNPADSSDSLLLNRCEGPTLDVGCGPGRLTLSLAQRGIRSLGIDISAEAVRIARSRGATAEEVDVFGNVSEAGHWRHVLLADGNIGIGGCPERLLRRARDLIHPAGSVIVDVEPPGGGFRRSRMRVEAHGHIGWLRWAHVGADAIGGLAANSGMTVAAIASDGVDRHVAELRRS